MIKKVYVGPTQGLFQKDVTDIEVVLNMKYINSQLVYLGIYGEV